MQLWRSLDNTSVLLHPKLTCFVQRGDSRSVIRILTNGHVRNEAAFASCDLLILPPGKFIWNANAPIMFACRFGFAHDWLDLQWGGTREMAKPDGQPAAFVKAIPPRASVRESNPLPMRLSLFMTWYTLECNNRTKHWSAGTITNPPCV